MSAESHLLEVVESSQVGEARRLAIALAHQSGMTDEDAGEVALIVTELATNLAKHASRGQLLLRRLPGDGGGGEGVEMLSVDKGPGIANIGAALRDGFSTAGTAGKGLGTVSRRAHLFDISSVAGKGTVILATRLATMPKSPPAFDVGAVCVRLRGETVSGDTWALHQRNGRATLLVADGLGHGRLAADAAGEAARVFAQHAAESPGEILSELHAELRKTRGAAAAIAEVIPADQRVAYAGIGNVAGTVLVDGKRHNMVSQNGTLGAERRRITVFDYPFPHNALLVMASDGITTHWDLTPYPGLLTRHPSVIAAVIHRDYSRGRDDATVVVLRRRTA